MQVLKVPRGEWVLQNAAGSALGRQLVAIAKHKGVRTINLVRGLWQNSTCTHTCLRHCGAMMAVVGQYKQRVLPRATPVAPVLTSRVLFVTKASSLRNVNDAALQRCRFGIRRCTLLG